MESLDRFVAAAEEAADIAGDVIRPYFRSGLNTASKSDASPVTIADQNAEQAMRKFLLERFPDHGVFGEEFGLDNEQERYRWVLDPIDGTRAFITGRPVFGTLISLMDGDQSLIGIIDQPITGERWVGVAGRATVFKGPFGGKLGVRPCPSLKDAELSCTTPDMMTGNFGPRFEKLRDATARTSWGGDCYAYGLLALGQIDVIAENSLKIWDWAALKPVIEGAGGAITDWKGQALDRHSLGDVIAVGDKSLLPQIISTID